MFSSEAHDEMLFIVIHQAYELWFKPPPHFVLIGHAASLTPY